MLYPRSLLFKRRLRRGEERVGWWVLLIMMLSVNLLYIRLAGGGSVNVSSRGVE